TSVTRYFLIYIMLISIMDSIQVFNAHNLTIFSSFRGIIYNFIPLIAFLVGAKFAKRKLSITLFDLIMFLIGLTQSIIGILQVYNYSIQQRTLELYSDFEKYNNFFEEMDQGRVVGTLGNPNYFGEFIGWFILMILFYYLPKYRTFGYRLVLISSLFIVTYGMILSQSRNSFIFVFIGFFVLFFLFFIIYIYLLIIHNFFIFFFFDIFIIILYIIVNYEYYINILKYVKKYKLLYTMLIGIITFVLVIYANDIISVARGGWESFSSFGGRLGIWNSIITNYIYPFKWELIFGYGSHFVKSFIEEPHNYYLQILLENGLIGIIGYLFLLSIFVYKTLKTKNTNIKTFLLVTLVTLLLSDMTSELSTHIKLGSFFYIILGFGIVYRDHENIHR